MLKSFVKLAAAAALALGAPGAAQIQTIDPNRADEYRPAEQSDGEAEWAPIAEPAYDPAPEPAPSYPSEIDAAQSFDSQIPAAERAAMPRDDVFDAAEDLFGRGAQGLAGIIEDILRKQGEPVAYIAGREAAGSFVFGVRYGSGVMRHYIEGERPVYWTGPSLGFDFGANADKVFVLVYNLHDAQELFKRYPGAEGNVHVVGGFTAQYLRRGDVVLIPIRMGVGLRLGVNAGYMRFSEKNRWVPF